MVHITFHGNGGETATGDITVVIPVPVGALWKNVPVPEFIQSGTVKQQNGFTSVQNNDSTLITSDYIVLGNMEVWASYTAIEVGVITYAGEVMSYERWYTKYGTNMWSITGMTISLRGDANNLVSGIFGKLNDSKQIGVACQFVRYDSTRVNFRGSPGYLGGYNFDVATIGDPAIDTSILYPSPSPYLYPKLHNPEIWDTSNPANLGIPQSAYINIYSWMDGRSYTYNFANAIQGMTDQFGVVGCPAVDELRTWHIGNTIIPGDFYFMSTGEARVLYENKNVFDALIQKLIDYSASIVAQAGVVGNYYLYAYGASGSAPDIQYVFGVDALIDALNSPDVMTINQNLYGEYNSSHQINANAYQVNISMDMQTGLPVADQYGRWIGAYRGNGGYDTIILFDASRLF